MKNHFIGLVIAILFLINGNANAVNTAFGGGEVLIVLNVKTGTPVVSFGIPDKYVNKDNSLVLPLEISLTQVDKVPLTLQSNSLAVILPNIISGIYTIELTIGDFKLIKDVKF